MNMVNEFFDGQSWNRETVLAAQRAKATAQAEITGFPLTPNNLLSEPVPEETVDQFEGIFDISLPHEYRSFLLEVGDGGDGPGLYMRLLGAPLDDGEPWEPGTIFRGEHEPNEYLTSTFAHTEPVSDLPADTYESTSGCLFLFDRGDALWDLLVARGPSAGQIWANQLTDGNGLFPILSEENAPIGFAEFYGSWLSS